MTPIALALTKHWKLISAFWERWHMAVFAVTFVATLAVLFLMTPDGLRSLHPHQPDADGYLDLGNPQQRPR